MKGGYGYHPHSSKHRQEPPLRDDRDPRPSKHRPEHRHDNHDQSRYDRDDRSPYEAYKRESKPYEATDESRHVPSQVVYSKEEQHHSKPPPPPQQERRDEYSGSSKRRQDEYSGGSSTIHTTSNYTPSPQGQQRRREGPPSAPPTNEYGGTHPHDGNRHAPPTHETFHPEVRQSRSNDSSRLSVESLARRNCGRVAAAANRSSAMAPFVPPAAVGVSRRSAAGRGGAEEDGGRWRRWTSADVVECAGEGIIFFVAVVRDRKK